MKILLPKWQENKVQAEFLRITLTNPIYWKEIEANFYLEQKGTTAFRINWPLEVVQMTSNTKIYNSNSTLQPTLPPDDVIVSSSHTRACDSQCRWWKKAMSKGWERRDFNKWVPHHRRVKEKEDIGGIDECIWWKMAGISRNKKILKFGKLCLVSLWCKKNYSILYVHSRSVFAHLNILIWNLVLATGSQYCDCNIEKKDISFC